MIRCFWRKAIRYVAVGLINPSMGIPIYTDFTESNDGELGAI